jgi:hypothetical protein
VIVISEDDKNIKSDTELTSLYLDGNDENSPSLTSPRKRHRSSSGSDSELPKSPVKKFRKLYMSPNKVQFIDSLKDADQDTCKHSPIKSETREEQDPVSPGEDPKPSPKRNRFAVQMEEKKEKFDINASKNVVKSRYIHAVYKLLWNHHCSWIYWVTLTHKFTSFFFSF